MLKLVLAVVKPKAFDNYSKGLINHDQLSRSRFQVKKHLNFAAMRKHH